jgi:hypothetical protein
MVNAGDEFPAGEDYIVRRIKDLERRVSENASARSLAASQIGSGGLLISGGGSLTISGGGSLNVAGGALNSAGSITAGTTISAGGAITGASLGVGGGAIAGGAITGASVAVNGAASSATSSVSGNSSVGGNLAVTGGIGSPTVYANSVGGLVGNRAVWMDGSGNLGYNTSSRQFKTEVQTAAVSYDTLMKVRVVWYKYIESIELYGNKLAEVQLGAIAEEVHDLGLTWMVDYDLTGAPFGLKQERFGLIGILLAQHQHQMIIDLQAGVSRLFAVNPTA